MEATTIVTDGMEHRRLKESPSDEESDGLVPTAASLDTTRGLQHQLRSVRLMSAASVLLAVASAGMMASVAVRSTDAPKAPTSPTSFLGLSAIPETETEEESVSHGWYRVYLDSQVRSEEDVQSEKVDVLYAGSLVYVAETHGRRARILKPVKGWMSLQTSDGITILRPDITYKANPNKTDIEAVFRTKEVREATERLKESAVKLTAVEKKLLEAIKKMKDLPRHVGKKLRKEWPELAQKAPKAGEKLAQHASYALRKTVKPEGAKNLLKTMAQNGHIQHITHSKKLEGLVKKAKSEVKDAQDSQLRVNKFEKSLQKASKEVAETSQQLVEQVEQVDERDEVDAVIAVDQVDRVGQVDPVQYEV